MRTENVADIKKCLHLNYVLSEEHAYTPINKDIRIALFLHIYSMDLVDYCLDYAKSMPENSDVYITTDTEEKIEIIQDCFSKLKCKRLKVILVENRGRDVSALLIGCKPYVNQYDYICFAHDKKTIQIEPYSIGKSFSYKCFENILASPQYVNNIVNKFENEPRLGLLTPPPPNHSTFASIFGLEWGSNYENTYKLANRLNLKVDISKFKEPISPLGTMFWFRPEALTPLFDIDWKYEDFPEEPNANDGTILHAIERLYGFVTQSKGFYPAWVMSDKFARIEITNLHFMLREYSVAVYNTTGQHQSNYYIANNNLMDGLSFKKMFKYKVKQHIPKPLWKLLRNIYRFFHKERK